MYRLLCLTDFQIKTNQIVFQLFWCTVLEICTSGPSIAFLGPSRCHRWTRHVFLSIYFPTLPPERRLLIAWPKLSFGDIILLLFCYRVCTYPVPSYPTNNDLSVGSFLHCEAVHQCHKFKNCCPTRRLSRSIPTHKIAQQIQGNSTAELGSMTQHKI